MLSNRVRQGRSVFRFFLGLLGFKVFGGFDSRLERFWECVSGARRLNFRVIVEARSGLLGFVFTV